MNKTRVTNSVAILLVILGILIGAGVMYLVNKQNIETGETADNKGEKTPLYWVAPMDANYRRDKPGKSPMGMDLVPVYEEKVAGTSSDAHWGEGVVQISPHVVNNLGVRTAKAVLKPMDTEISTVGYVQYDEDKLVHIHPRVDGWVEKLFIKAIGDEVKQGQALYDLYSPELVNAQKEMMIALNQTSQHLIQAARKRLLALRMSPAFIDRLMETREVKQTVTFYAPQSGVVENLAIREGFYVQPGTTIMSIGQLEQVWVEAEVFERDAALVEAGLPVTMTLGYVPGRVWQGHVDYVYPSLNAQSRTLRARLKFNNKDFTLRPNMFAQVTIHVQPPESTIIVPKESVIRTGKQDRVVLAIGDGQFKSVAVSIGHVSLDNVEILSGVLAGDEVVTSAQFLIDSESSKTSDFQRMSQEEVPNAVWMQGKVNSVMQGHRMVNFTHGAVEAWGWPEMTMDFDIAESVDIGALTAGQKLHFEVSRKADGNYEVTGIHIMSAPAEQATSEVSSATVNGVVNAVNLDLRTLNISREAIDKWQRPAATMDFFVADHIELSDVQVGDAIRFTFEVQDELIIVDLMSANEPIGNGHQDHSGH